MNNQNLLIVGFVISIFLLIGVFIFHFNENYQLDTKNDSKFFKSADEKAAFIAKLSEGVYGFNPEYGINVGDVHLTSDGKYWIVKMNRINELELLEESGNDTWIVTINNSNWESKKSKKTAPVEGETSWRSFDELKAIYVAQLYSEDYVSAYFYKRPHKKVINGKDIWEVQRVSTNPVTSTADGSIYFDATTGKSIEYTNNSSANNDIILADYVNWITLMN